MVVKTFYVNIGAIQNQSTALIEVHASIKSMMLLHIVANSRMGHYFFSYLLTWEVDLIEILGIMP